MLIFAGCEEEVLTWLASPPSNWSVKRRTSEILHCLPTRECLIDCCNVSGLSVLRVFLDGSPPACEPPAVGYFRCIAANTSVSASVNSR
jgi:hypothetical protein